MPCGRPLRCLISICQTREKTGQASLRVLILTLVLESMPLEQLTSLIPTAQPALFWPLHRFDVILDSVER